MKASSINKRPQSVFWEYFTVSEDEDVKSKAFCNLCPKYKNKFAYANYGTKNLLNYLDILIKRCRKGFKTTAD